MPVIVRSGNLFDSTAEALVNTVNCGGPGGPRTASMGKGIALAFAQRFPEIVAPYKTACLQETLRPGIVQVLKTRDGRYVVNFPTKDDWRFASQLRWIADGLVALREELQQRAIRSVAIPPLGCGNGGLRWSDVRPLIEQSLETADVTVELFQPA